MSNKNLNINSSKINFSIKNKAIPQLELDQLQETNMEEKVFIVVEKDNVETEEDIFIIKSNNINDVLDIYAKEYYTKDDFFRDELENRSINMSFWEQIFLDGIYDYNGEFKTSLSDDEIDRKFKQNIEEYLGEDKHLLSELIDFYEDEDKTLEDLSEELINCIAVKEVQRDAKWFIIKEVII